MQQQLQQQAMQIQQLQQLLQQVQTSTPQPPHQPKINLRLGDPRKYDGKPGKDPEEFLYQMEEHFFLTELAEDMKKILLAGQYLTGNARSWYQSRRQTYPQDTWETFKEALVNQFVVQDQKDVARTKLFNLKQTGDVREFIMEFRSLAVKAGTLSDPDLKALYLNRLQTHISRQVRMRLPDSLEIAIKLTEEYVTTGRWTDKTDGTWKRDYWKKEYGRKEDPMELDAMQNRPYKSRNRVNLQQLGVTAEQLTERREKNQCLRCGNPDHRLAGCPMIEKKGNGAGQARGARR